MKRAIGILFVVSCCGFIAEAREVDSRTLTAIKEDVESDASLVTQHEIIASDAGTKV